MNLYYVYFNNFNNTIASYKKIINNSIDETGYYYIGEMFDMIKRSGYCNYYLHKYYIDMNSKEVIDGRTSYDVSLMYKELLVLIRDDKLKMIL